MEKSIVKTKLIQIKLNSLRFRYENQDEINHWRILFEHLIELCLDIASLTGPIVGSSSPEGMMPMELTQRLFHLIYLF